MYNHRSSPAVQIGATMDRYVPGVQHAANGFLSKTHVPVSGSIDSVEVERARLEAEIVGAKQRLDAARFRAEARDAEARAALRAEIALTRDTLAEMGLRHEEQVSRVRESAKAEVEQILAAARQAAGSQALIVNEESGASDVE